MNPNKINNPYLRSAVKYTYAGVYRDDIDITKAMRLADLNIPELDDILNIVDGIGLCLQDDLQKIITKNNVSSKSDKITKKKILAKSLFKRIALSVHKILIINMFHNDNSGKDIVFAMALLDLCFKKIDDKNEILLLMMDEKNSLEDELFSDWMENIISEEACLEKYANDIVV